MYRGCRELVKSASKPLIFWFLFANDRASLLEIDVKSTCNCDAYSLEKSSTDLVEIIVNHCIYVS